MHNAHLLSMVRNHGGYYKCPKDEAGKRLGPLVGYNGRDAQGRQYVGDVYVNFAAVERQGVTLRYVAELLLERIKRSGMSDITFCGAPEGGKALASALAVLSIGQYIFPDKKVIAVATKDSREISELFFGRHEPRPNDDVLIVEDVCNNFSTSVGLVDLIEKYDARCVGIVCFHNRSTIFRGNFKIDRGDETLLLPIICLIEEGIEQYEQDDPRVIEDVKKGNVVWKPKNEWAKLNEAMYTSILHVSD